MTRIHNTSQATRLPTLLQRSAFLHFGFWQAGNLCNSHSATSKFAEPSKNYWRTLVETNTQQAKMFRFGRMLLAQLTIGHRHPYCHRSSKLWVGNTPMTDSQLPPTSSPHPGGSGLVLDILRTQTPPHQYLKISHSMLDPMLLNKIRDLGTSTYFRIFWKGIVFFF